MEIATIGDALVNYGLTFVLIAYFLVKDWKFNQAIIDTLANIREVLVELKSWHKKEGE